MDGETDELTNELSETVIKAIIITYTKCCKGIRALSSVRIVGVYGSLRVMRNI